MTVVLLFVGCNKEEGITDRDSQEQGTNKVNNNGHAYIDLGLSTYWATCNIGAYTPYENGNYYAFGESSIKSDYTSSNYKGGNNDVAKLLWGGDWRLPTKEEINELLSNCSFKVIEKNGKDIIQIKGTNGNIMELPYAGSKVNGSSEKGGFYWSSSLSSSGAWCLYFNINEAKCVGAYKYCGLPVRAVMTNPNYKGSDNNTGGSGSDNTGGGTTTYEKPDIGFYDFTATKTSLTIQYKIYNSAEAGVTSAKIYYGTSSNPSKLKTATISGTLITGKITGLKSGTTYYVKCVAKGKGGTTTTSTTECITNY